MSENSLQNQGNTVEQEPGQASIQAERDIPASSVSADPASADAESDGDEYAGFEDSFTERMAGSAWAAAAVYMVLGILCVLPAALEAGRKIIGCPGYENTAQTVWIYYSWSQYYKDTFEFFFDNYGLGGFLTHFPELYSRLASFGERSSVANGFDFLWTWPLAEIFGLPLYYNVKCLIIIVLNAMTARMLCRRLGCSASASFWGGLMFAFNPWQSALLATGRTMEAQTFVPVLFAASLLEAWGKADPWKWLICGAALAFTAVNYWFYGHFAVIFAIFLAVWHLARALFRAACGTRFRFSFDKEKCKTVCVCAAVFLLAFFVIVLPAAHPYLVRLFCGYEIPGMVRPDSGKNPDPALFYRQSITYSCEADYPFRGMWKNIMTPLNPPVTLPMEATYSGNLSVVIILSSLVFLLKTDPAVREKLIMWWWASAAFYFLPLGPFLKQSGHFVIFSDSLIPMPYKVFADWMPLLNKLFWPLQSMILFVMAAAVFTSLVLDVLLRSSRISRPLIGAGLLCVVFFTVFAQIRNGQLPIPATEISLRSQASLKSSNPIEEGCIFVPVTRRFWEQPRPEYNRNFYHDDDLTMIDMRLAIDRTKGLYSRHQYNTGRDFWIFERQTMCDNSFARFICDLGSRYVPENFDQRDMEAFMRDGYRYIVVSERSCCHRLRKGSYFTDPIAGRLIYKDVLSRLSQRFGPPAEVIKEVSYEKDFMNGRPVPQTYELSIYDLRSFNSSSQK